MSILKLLIFSFLLSPVLFRLDTVQVKSSEAVLLKPGYEYEQTFVSKHDGLYLIKVFANNPKLEYKEPLLFKLLSADTKEKIVEIPFSGLNVGVNTWIRFQFLPQKSIEKKFSFYLSAPIEAKKAVPIELGKAIKNSEGKDLSLFLNGEKQSGTLLFKSYYKTGIWQFIKDSLNDFWQRISLDKQFLIAYIGLIISILMVTIYALFFK